MSSYSNSHDGNHTRTTAFGNGFAASMARRSFFFSPSRHPSSTTVPSSGSTRKNLVEPLKEETDALLAQTLNQLSLEERNQVLHDLHGVVDLPEETPEFVSSALTDLNHELNLIPNNEKYAFRLAESISTTYVHDPAFQLVFLRAELYKAKPAAKRMVEYFEQKLQLFGKDKLTRTIRLHDLPPEDLQHFRKGFFQLFPERDQTGRLIVCNKAFLVSNIPMETRCRLTWYVYSVAAEDEHVQRKGAIFVTDAIGWKGFYHTGSDPRMAKLSQCLPIRLSALHFCYDDPVIHPIIKLMVYVLNQNQQCRLRFHYGSRMECCYSLMTFGIPKGLFPIDDNQKQRLTNVEEFLKQRKAVEESLTIHTIPNNPGNTQGTGVVPTVPTELDVLMGRGNARVHSNNPGNQRYQKLLRDHYHAYEHALDKTLVIDLVLQSIKSCNGRFLRKENKTGWTEIDDFDARKKIGHAFRNLKTPAISGVISNEVAHTFSNTSCVMEGDNTKKTVAISTGYVNRMIDASSPTMSSSLQNREMEKELVPRNEIVVDDDQNNKLRCVEACSKRPKAKEGSLAVHSIPNPGAGQVTGFVLRETDVLLGRGKVQLEYPGNQRYQKLLRDHYHEYEQASEKILVVDRILQKIKSCQGRFLRKDNIKGWIEIDDFQARKKIGHAFRNLRAPTRSGVGSMEVASLSSQQSQTNIFMEVDNEIMSAPICREFADKMIMDSSTSSQHRWMEDEALALLNDLGMS